MTSIRPAAVAGMFYPENGQDLDGLLHRMLAEAPIASKAEAPPKALIVPHAGYIYSGPIAARAYALLRPVASRVRRVVLIGPCHRVPLRGLAATSAEAFSTPLGVVPVDREAVAALSALPQVSVFDATHAEEHSLEVQLPFLQELLEDFAIVPLVAGQTTAEAVAQVLEKVWGGEETLIVISSDLSHYLDYDTAKQIDAATCRAIERLDADAIDFDQACGRLPIAGLLTVAKRRGLSVTTLDLRNSGDTAGDRRRVVGYGAWMFTEAPAAKLHPDAGAEQESERLGADEFAATTEQLLEEHGGTLLRLAAASIRHGLDHRRPLPVEGADYPPELQAEGACFITLDNGGGELRGCVGSPFAYRPLVEDVADNAFNAAFRDTRFPPVDRDELPRLHLSVSVLSPPTPISFIDEPDLLQQLRPGEDGLIIRADGQRALFLPQVWQSLPEPASFLAQLKRKAGLSAVQPARDLRAWRFIARSLSSTTLADAETLWH